jgi:hypothetical protein
MLGTLLKKHQLLMLNKLMLNLLFKLLKNKDKTKSPPDYNEKNNKFIYFLIKMYIS